MLFLAPAMMRKKDALKTPWWRLARGGLIALLVLAASISQVGSAEPLDLKALEAAAAQPSKHPKISGALRQAEAALRQLRALPDPARVSVSADGVQVYIHLFDYEESYLTRLQRMGAWVEIADPSLKILLAWIPAGLLDSLAQRPFVRFIEAPERPYSDVGSVGTQGDGMLDADLARSRLGINGSGIRIGVIQDGFKGIAEGQASGDLPSEIMRFTARSNGDFEGDGVEGTAMLEIIHDLAPGAQLFAASFDTSLEEIAAVNWL